MVHCRVVKGIVELEIEENGGVGFPLLCCWTRAAKSRFDASNRRRVGRSVVDEAELCPGGVDERRMEVLTWLTQGWLRGVVVLTGMDREGPAAVRGPAEASRAPRPR